MCWNYSKWQADASKLRIYWNGLVSSRKAGRSIIYKANLQRMADLVAYLLEDCCGGACGTLARRQAAGGR